ncbi:MAG: M23 family metallopeptidase [Defluviitaleaceae bacterium]|nr:M23 family metallopeptidase [Defluviitaleaceae bacterium]
MKKIIAILIVLLVLPILPAFATPATRERHRQLQQQLNQATQSVREQQNLLSGTRHEMSQLMMEMQELDQQIMDAAEALESIELSQLDTEIRIADAEAELEAAREEYDLQFELLRTRVRVIHEEGQIGFLDVLFQAESIVDFFLRWEYIRAIAEFDHALLDRLQSAEQEITNHIEDLVRWRNMVEDLQFQYDRILDDLEFMMYEREIWFANLAENEEVLAELVAMYEHEQRMAQAAFGEIQAQLRREESEIVRRANAEAHSARLAALNNFEGEFQWPIPTHSRISSPFGMRFHPILRQNRHHSGIDVGAPTGTRLIASADGYVRFAGWSGGYGNTVIIDHGNGYSTLYAHNSRNRVVTGQRVSRGDHIADVGSTGMSTGPHLHFEIRVNNRAVNPMNYFPR